MEPSGQSVRLTPKGARTRARIVEAAARLMFERGVAGTTLEDVRRAAGVSGSQLTHYFANKGALTGAVVDHQADSVIGVQRGANLADAAGTGRWRDMLVESSRAAQAKGGCPFGSLAAQLAEGDESARARLADGFSRWNSAITAGLRTRHPDGDLPAGVTLDDLALTLLAALQGGLLLAQVHRDTSYLETVVDTVLALTPARPATG